MHQIDPPATSPTPPANPSTEVANPQAASSDSARGLIGSGDAPASPQDSIPQAGRPRNIHYVGDDIVQAYEQCVYEGVGYKPSPEQLSSRVNEVASQAGRKPWDHQVLLEHVAGFLRWRRIQFLGAIYSEPAQYAWLNDLPEKNHQRIQMPLDSFGPIVSRTIRREYKGDEPRKVRDLPQPIGLENYPIDMGIWHSRVMECGRTWFCAIVLNGPFQSIAAIFHHVEGTCDPYLVGVMSDQKNLGIYQMNGREFRFCFRNGGLECLSMALLNDVSTL